MFPRVSKIRLYCLSQHKSHQLFCVKRKLSEITKHRVLMHVHVDKLHDYNYRIEVASQHEALFIFSLRLLKLLTDVCPLPLGSVEQ